MVTEHATQIIPRSSSSATMISLPAAPTHAETSVLHGIHRLFRDRYIWAILLGLIGLIGGAWGGWKLGGEPTYQATGVIRIVAVLPRLLYSNEYNSMIPMFDAYVQSQASLIESQRIIDMAMESAEWQAIGRGNSQPAAAQFRRSLDAHRPSTEMIYVSFVDTDPAVTVAAVKAVIQAFETVFREVDSRRENSRLQLLEDLRQRLTANLASLRDRIHNIAEQYGSDALEFSYQHKSEALHKIETELKGVQLQLAQVEASSEQAEIDPLDMTLDQLAELDAKLRSLSNQRDQLDEKIVLSTLTLRDTHPRLIEMRMLLDHLNGRIEEQAQHAREEVTRRLQEKRVALEEKIEFKQLQEHERQLTVLYDDLQEETLEIGRKNLRIRRLKDDATRVQSQLEQTRFRIESLNVEAAVRAVSGRIEILSTGEQPWEPYKDNRRELAGVGGLGGLVLGFGLVLFIGFLDQRFQDPEDARLRMHDVKLLGILPELPDDLSNPDDAALAAHSVHHIRLLLQLDIEQNGHRVTSVTSPTPGDGKSSLCLALGLSFAASHVRTLLVDGDVTAGGLSARIRAMIRRQIGQMLTEQELVPADQIQDAISASDNEEELLADALVERGYIEAEELNSKVSLKEMNGVGLIDALRGESLEKCIFETGTPNLSVLPIGSPDAQAAERMSSHQLRELLARLRDRYDFVLVDTGPLPSSLEASLVASEADATVIVVSRGAHRSLVEQVLHRLQDVSSSIAGVVFNRATSRDFSRYARSSVSDSKSRRSVVRSHISSNGKNGMGPIEGSLSRDNDNDVRDG